MREPCKHCGSRDCDDRDCGHLGDAGELACLCCGKAVGAVALRESCGRRAVFPVDDTWRYETIRGGRIWTCSIRCARRCSRNLILSAKLGGTPSFQMLRLSRAWASGNEAEFERVLAEDRAARDAEPVEQGPPFRLDLSGLP